jgi:acyl dehydratase
MAMDDAAVEQYRQAVGDSTLPGYLPPTALAAWALGAVLKHLELVPGTVHASQELSFSRAVRVGDGVVQSATVSQNSVRGGWRWLVVDLTTDDDQGNSLLTGRSTVLFPES